MSTKPAIKRFYKNVMIANRDYTVEGKAESGFEILLDKRILRTPSGKIFNVPHEGLALAIAHEWDSQSETIERYTMPLTTLCNTVIDNPTHKTKDVFVQGIMEYAHTDTICFRVENPEELLKQQKARWGEILDFIEKQYGTRPPTTSGFSLPVLPEKFANFISRHFLSYNYWGLVGLQTCVETLKSVWLTLALLDGFISSSKAVDLSRLEPAFQEKLWGSVPWFHEVDIVEMNSRVSAGLLLALASHSRHSVKQKQSPSNRSAST